MSLIDKLQVTLEPYHREDVVLLRVEIKHNGQIIGKDQVFVADDFESRFERMMEYATQIIKQSVKKDRKLQQRKRKDPFGARAFVLQTTKGAKK